MSRILIVKMKMGIDGCTTVQLKYSTSTIMEHTILHEKYIIQPIAITKSSLMVSFSLPT